MNRKTSAIAALVLAAAAGAAAAHNNNQSLYAQADAAAMALTGMVANPSSVTINGRGGLYYSRNVQVTNYGPGFASNLNASLVHQYGNVGWLSTGSDTCTGATLAVGGSCNVQITFDAGCPKAGATVSNLVVTSTSMATLTVQVVGNTAAGICQ